MPPVAVIMLIDMNWLDVILIIAVIAGALIGFRSGLVWQCIRLASWVIAFWLAGRFRRGLGEGMRNVIGLDVPDWIAYLGVLVLVLVVFYLIAHMARTLIDAIHLKLIDRITGSFLGALKVLVIALLVIFYISLYGESGTLLKEGVKGSFLAAPFIDAVESGVPSPLRMSAPPRLADICGKSRS